MATGWRVASGLAVIGALVGEFVAGFSEGSAGLGITVLAAYRQLRTDLLFATVILASLLGTVVVRGGEPVLESTCCGGCALAFECRSRRGSA